jgi:hypothetical protein
MKTYRISFNGGFMGGCLDVQAKTKRKAIKILKKYFKEAGVKIVVKEVSEVKEGDK